MKKQPKQKYKIGKVSLQDRLKNIKMPEEEVEIGDLQEMQAEHP